MQKEVFIVPYGGLGNQLFQLAAALDLANGGGIKILAKWGFARTFEDGRLEIDDFVLPASVQISNTLETSLFGKRLTNFLLRLGSTRSERDIIVALLETVTEPYYRNRLSRKVKVFVASGLDTKLTSNSQQTVAIGYFQNFKSPERVIDLMIGLTPKKLSIDAQKLISKIQSEQVTAIHVRRGDYLNEQFGILDNDYYASALQTLNVQPGSRLWIFTDDVTLARELEIFKKFNNAYFVEDGGLTSVETMEVMRNAMNFVIANSSFSWWAAQLRYNRRGRVVAPWPWFKTPNSPMEIIHSDWQRVAW